MDPEVYSGEALNIFLSISENGFVKINNINRFEKNEPDIFEKVIEPLLKKYKKLHITETSMELFFKIPNYITDLFIDSASFVNISLDNLHNGLISLMIMYLYWSENEDTFNISIDNLPHTLEYLYIVADNFNQPINYLPISLKSLCIYCNSFNQSLSNLPSNLELLVLAHNSATHKDYKLLDNLMNLPVNLKKLRILEKIIPYNTNQEFLDTMKQKYVNLQIEIIK
jgi:hypothetical protein